MPHNSTHTPVERTSISDQDRLQFKLEAYRSCFAFHHHYDTLPWVFGGIVLAGASAMILYIPQAFLETVGGTEWLRIGIAATAIALLWLWYGYYLAGMLWSYVADEAIRDFEREFEVEGIGIRFMRAAISGREVVLKNTDHLGEQLDRARTVRAGVPSTTLLICAYVVALTLVAVLLVLFAPRTRHKDQSTASYPETNTSGTTKNSVVSDRNGTSNGSQSAGQSTK